eukprot:m.420903 g.420903  ORF g.420903 m.420903 type:complete len:492 (-) comp56641_c0_seq23:20-1495(-)
MVISSGDWVFFCEGVHIKTAQVSPTAKLKFGKANVRLSDVIGHHFGTMFRVDRDRLIPVASRMRVDTAAISSASAGSDNRGLVDDQSNQMVSYESLELLKSTGVTGEDIVSKLVESSQTFQTKTEFAQDKYLKKKEKKYLQHIRVERPSAMLLATLYFQTQAPKICYLREDSLAMMLLRANIRANSRVLVVETCVGLVTAAALERMGGLGLVFQLHHGDHPQKTAIDILDLKERTQILQTLPIHTIDPYTLPDLDDEAEIRAKAAEDTAAISATADGVPTEQRKLRMSVEDRAKEDRAKAHSERMAVRTARIQQLDRSRAHLMEDSFDSLVMAVKYHPLNLLKRVWKFLALSRPFVIYCQHIEPLTECYMEVKKLGAVNVMLAETWSREYQVLDMRTHPVMNMSASSGYILSGIKVEADETPNVRRRPTAAASTTKADDLEAPSKRLRDADADADAEDEDPTGREDEETVQEPDDDKEELLSKRPRLAQDS